MSKENSKDVDIDALRSMIEVKTEGKVEVKVEGIHGSNIDLNALRKEVLGS